MEEYEISTTAPSGEEGGIMIDGFFIGAMVCLGVGGILVLVGFGRLVDWIVRTKKHRSMEKRKQRHLEHMKYLEDYSIKAGHSPNEVIIHNNNSPTDNDSVFKWDEGLVNAGYISEDTLRRHSPKEPKLSAHITGSRASYTEHMARSHSGSQPNSRPSSRTSYSSTGEHDHVTNHVINVPNGHASSSTERQTTPTEEVRQTQTSSVDRLADVPV